MVYNIVGDVMLVAICARLEIKNGKKRWFITDYFKKLACHLNWTLIPIVSPKDVQKISELCHALIIPGSGNDINPKYYKEKPIFKNQYYDEEYKLDKAAIKAFFGQNKKIIGICGGMQSLNVYFGGTLFQDIDNHNNTFHPIKIINNTFLSSYYKKKTVKVNSFHHEAIKNIAPNFQISAISNDNIIEAIESENILGLQYHPEVLKDYNIFKNFIEK